ncbi:hypothetical protein FH972_018766 [Carpinus fangiana]|uniref:Uncharacterized protein n=1 Tax=Carpinus fangiana TaxID=176857 RepID=A0A5N6RS07_9ROSI|nr:hypothetical protein FH972_018766 [Carpinus fangiana]
MDFIHKIMNIIVPPIDLIMLSLFSTNISALQASPLHHKIHIQRRCGWKSNTHYRGVLWRWRGLFKTSLLFCMVLFFSFSHACVYTVVLKHLAYEYARRGARLALVARRENRLREVACTAYQLGSPEVIVIRADVSRVEDCKRFVDPCICFIIIIFFPSYINIVGLKNNVLWVFMLAVDHLVNNAGVAPVCMFESITDITNLAPTMDIYFWGSVYATYFAVPHLKKSKGKIMPIASAAAWLPEPRLGFYNASKAAVISFYETLRVEFGKDIGLTIVTPGLIGSEMTRGKFLSKEGGMVVDPDMRDVLVSIMPIAPVRECAKAIVDGACRGEKYLTQPAWVRVAFFWKAFCPEILEWSNRLLQKEIHLARSSSN